ncbi:MAG: imelysin family protein [Flavobacteriales bacterium]|nr:imelysin family protein [Flavobacteriales bacterium]
MKKIIIFPLVLLLFSCGKKKKDDTDSTEPFDKKALVVNMADNIILPAYQNFKTSLDSLITEYSLFSVNPTLNGLQTVKAKYYTAYVKYQSISLFEFGPAETEIVRMNFNVFPTDTNQIKTNISTNSYSLDAASNLDAKGFPALDYLFYGLNKSENSVLQEFVSTANRKNYVTNLLNDMSYKTNAIVNAWNNGYRETFVNSLGTDVGSSIGFLVNQLNFELDYLKNAKFGTPLGKKTLGIPVPGSCETFYSNNSVDFAKLTLQIIERVYFGLATNGSSGIGFDDYLDHLNAKYGNQGLNAAITNQFAVCHSKINLVSNPLSQEVVSNPAAADAAYAELVKLLVLLKTDMPSNLGVIITYQDGDGD